MNIVIVTCFDTYEHRVDLLRKVFEKWGHHVHVIVSGFRHIQKEVRTECPVSYEMIPVRAYKRNLSVARLMSHKGFAEATISRLEELKPDLVWALIPPNSLVKTISAYKKKHPQMKLIYDLIDMWPETMPISSMKNLAPFKYWANLRDKHLNSADMLVTECKLYWEILDKHYSGYQKETLYLARELQPFEYSVCLPDDRISLCYLGSINNIIDIECICDIIRKISIPVELHIIGDGEKREELIQKTENAGAKVCFHGILYDTQEKKAVFDRCHFGLNIMKDSVFVGLTMKSMDYFEHALPIINNIKGDTWDFVDQYNIGLNYSSDMRLEVDVLKKLQKERHRIREFYEANFSERVFEEKVNQFWEKLQK